MMIHEITEKVGKCKARKRVGRGRGSGHGKTCGRGHKGAHSRAGFSRNVAAEGGQLPYFRRLPKRGFSNEAFRTLYHIVNVGDLAQRFKDGEAVTPQTLVDVHLIRDTSRRVKILGEGELTAKLNVTAAKFSQSAQAKIESAGGCVTVDAPTKWMRDRTASAAKTKAAPEGDESGEG